MKSIVERILSEIGDKELLNKLLSLSKSDFNSLMLKVYHTYSCKTKPQEVLKSFDVNRFSVPSEVDAVKYHTLETELLAQAQKNEIWSIVLSPAAPLSSCSAFGYVDQNNVVSALRGTEILSDPTNMLAIIIANKLKSGEVDNNNQLHYCTTARVLRAQAFPAMRGYYAHFGLFCIVSSGKDVGSYECEQALFIKHLEYYNSFFKDKYNAGLSIVLSKRRGYKDVDGFYSKMTDVIHNTFSQASLSFDTTDESNNYYKGINFKIYIKTENDLIEIGDGGFVDWTQEMLGSKKERCLISCVALDRLLMV